MGQGGAVGAFAGQGVKNIRDRQEPGQQRNGAAEKAIRITFSIHPFVMPADQRNHVADRPERFTMRTP